MANVIYPLWKEALLQGTTNTSLVGTVKAILVDTGGYTYSSAHQFASSLGSATAGTAQAISSKTFITGLFTGGSVTFTAVPLGSGSGAILEAIVIYVDSGAPASSPLVAYFDSVSGLPVTPNGGNITINWNASGIFQL